MRMGTRTRTRTRTRMRVVVGSGSSSREDKVSRFKSIVLRITANATTTAKKLPKKCGNSASVRRRRQHQRRRQRLPHLTNTNSLRCLRSSGRNNNNMHSHFAGKSCSLIGQTFWRIGYTKTHALVRARQLAGTRVQFAVAIDAAFGWGNIFI